MKFQSNINTESIIYKTNSQNSKTSSFKADYGSKILNFAIQEKIIKECKAHGVVC